MEGRRLIHGRGEGVLSVARNAKGERIHPSPVILPAAPTTALVLYRMDE